MSIISSRIVTSHLKIWRSSLHTTRRCLFESFDVGDVTETEFQVELLKEQLSIFGDLEIGSVDGFQVRAERERRIS